MSVLPSDVIETHLNVMQNLLIEEVHGNNCSRKTSPFNFDNPHWCLCDSFPKKKKTKTKKEKKIDFVSSDKAQRNLFQEFVDWFSVHIWL